MDSDDDFWDDASGSDDSMSGDEDDAGAGADEPAFSDMPSAKRRSMGPYRIMDSGDIDRE